MPDELHAKYDECILMDDETYAKMEFGQLHREMFYEATGRGNACSKYKFFLLLGAF